jgi:beta-N-acetylhexosaminidase
MTDIESLVCGMPTNEKIAAVVMGYGDIHVPPTTGGIIVNQTHLTAAGVPMLRRQVALAEQRTSVPVLVATDQEGGSINRLKCYPPTSGLFFPPPAQMQAMSLSGVESEGEKTGSALALVGVNTLLGPVLDVADPGTLMYKQGRSFGTNSGDVVARAQAFVTGLRRTNPTLVIIGKHFPGYNVVGNSDNTSVHDSQSLSQERARSQPFYQIQGLDGVMINSIEYDNIDPRPACFSSTIIGQYRSSGSSSADLIMTDDLAARGLVRTSSAGANAARAFLAGVDLSLILDNAKVKSVRKGILYSLEDPAVSDAERTIRQGNLDASVSRILRLAFRVGNNSSLPIS